MSTALVTGANGFIGSNLSKLLIEKGWKVKALVLKNTPLTFIENLDIEIIYGDVTDAESIKNSCKDVDVIFHLAAIAKDWGDKNLFFRVNSGGTENLLKEAVKNQVKRFVLMSSVAVHKYSGHFNADENTIRDCPASFPYGFSKILSEDLVNHFNDKNLIEGVIIRPGLFPFGPNDITSFIKLAKALEKRQFSYVNNGTAKLSISYVENLCYGMELAGIKDIAKGNTYIISDDLVISWQELMEKFCAEMGIKGNFNSVPFGIANSGAKLLEFIWNNFNLKGEPPLTSYRVSLMKKDLHFSCEKAKKELGYVPLFTLDEGIKKTVQWYHEFCKK